MVKQKTPISRIPLNVVQDGTLRIYFLFRYPENFKLVLTFLQLIL